MSDHHQNLPLAVTMGDPAGIGLEITIAAWRHRRQLAVPPFVLYGDVAAVAACAQRLGQELPIAEITAPGDAAGLSSNVLPVKPVPLATAAIPGRPNSENGPAIIQAIEDAVSDVQAGHAAGVVTHPISKAVLYASGFSYPGHTEFLGHLARQKTGRPTGDPLMLLAGDDLRVVPLTVHIPLSDVPAALSRTLILSGVRTVSLALKRDFAVANPRIAVSGLNPHAGESGSLGTEERDFIEPALEELKAEGLNVTGPYPADTMFHDNARQTYDVAICMYHDQALVPLKTLAFDRGVNVTLDLPFVRTSPDHGTAFNIAGTGKASPLSFIASLKLAVEIACNRRAFDDKIRAVGDSKTPQPSGSNQ